MSSAAASYRQVSAGRGLAWISEGFEMFRQAPAAWIGITVLWVLGALLTSLVPLLGSLALNLILPILMGGVLLGARGQARGQPLQLGTLLAGFQPPYLQPLLLLGVAYLVILLAIGLTAGLAGFLLGSLGGGGGMASGPQLGLAGALGILLVFAAILAFSMATWFATPLVVFAGKAPMEAMKLSFSAALANLGALAIYGLLALLIVFAAALPLMLGLLVAVPVLMASLYRSYVDLFGDEPPPTGMP